MIVHEHSKMLGGSSSGNLSEEFFVDDKFDSASSGGSSSIFDSEVAQKYMQDQRQKRNERIEETFPQNPIIQFQIITSTNGMFITIFNK